MRTCSGCGACAGPASSPTRAPGGDRAAGAAVRAGQPRRPGPGGGRGDPVRAAAAHPAGRQDRRRDPAGGLRRRPQPAGHLHRGPGDPGPARERLRERGAHAGHARPPRRVRPGDRDREGHLGHGPVRASRAGCRSPAITQPWLRETAKIWAAADLPRRRGRSGGDKTRHYIASLALLSQSLRQRPDRGEDPAALGRADIEAFLARLAWQHSAGQISELTRVLACRETRKLLTAARQLGATRPGGPAAGLSDQFAVHRDDTPDEPEHGEPGRDLPAEIMRQICGHLPSLAAPHIRTAVEILIDTGRRPEDIVALPLDCLSADAGRLARARLRQPQGQPARPPAAGPRDHRPVDPRAAAARPRPVPRHPGQRAEAAAHRLGQPRRPPAADRLRRCRPRTASGSARCRRCCLADGTEYDKDRVVPYAYRHTYAQRHADAGVPIDVLAELMDHRSLNVTRGYYRVGEERRRDAVDKVTAMQFDRHGNRIWRDARALLDDEHARYAVGSVAVPYGTCTEPSNVAAGGGDCPLRFRCAGCDHFRTDVSYLPDLTAYLDDLLRTRERLAAAGGDDWARAAAAPPEQEIRKIRELISRIKGDIASPGPDERARIDDAVAVVRRHRAVSLGMPASATPARAGRRTGT